MLNQIGKLVIMTGLMSSYFFAIPAAAEAWKLRNDKGLVIFSLDAAPFDLTLVCDPEGAFIPPQIYMLVDINGKRLESGVLEVAQGDHTVRLNVEHFAIVPARPDFEWNTATRLLFGGRTLMLKAGARERSLELRAVQGNPCLTRG